MRSTALAIGAFVIVFGAASTAAHAQNYPWCAVYNVGDNAYNCGFATYEQCRTTISGIGGFCERNTQFRPLRPYGR
jgi:hypothetical protein